MTDNPCITGHYPVDIHIRSRGTVRICVICGDEEPKEIKTTDIVARTSETLTTLLSRTLSPDEIALALHDAGLLAERDSHDDCVYQARLAAVEEMHVPPPGLGPAYCTECDQLHPCDTTKAARGE